MRFSTAVVLAAVGLAAAQTTTTSAASSTTSSSCAAQNILDACLSQTKAQQTQCAGNDWDCQCNNAINILQCYNNCPNDSGAYSASQSKVQYCNAASLYGSSASKTQSSTATVSSSLSAALSSASASESSVSSAIASASSTASHSASASSSSQTGAAANLSPAGGLLGLMIGAAALL